MFFWDYGVEAEIGILLVIALESQETGTACRIHPTEARFTPNHQPSQNTLEAMESGQQFTEKALQVVDDSVQLSVGTSVGIGAAMAGIMGG
ncbi:MAG: hypothetical protein CL923_02985 [Deltaproteobacteria bacterium]|jgi:hypothetical protein|nr:hypothetical protein [Deltaproteobacteria bacterium]MDP7157500.1 hypothetical protein [SAR324 cluster bacterium]MDP7317642.1 hypothetical protein [SAR324 cluster bacterium]MDP7464477.1 hypothetical protein [SAR324 cluster bacterium]|tara:strand:+ start:180 stop:452 length:273 start_codon:yes stop_codon:yes gene_type:complete